MDDMTDQVRVPGQMDAWDNLKIDRICEAIGKLRPSWRVLNENFNGMFFLNTFTKKQGTWDIVFGGANETIGASVDDDGADKGYIETDLPLGHPDVEEIANRIVERIEEFLKLGQRGVTNDNRGVRGDGRDNP